MSTISDPSTLTKDRLKNELIKNKIDLPSGDAKKDIYVDLYKKHVLSKVQTPVDFNFSSDEDESLNAISNGTPKKGPEKKKQASRKSDTNSPEKSQFGSNMDVETLNNSALREELLKYGVDAAIVDSTRKIYQKKLLRLVENGAGDAVNVDDDTEEDYSDEEEEEKPAPPSPSTATRKRQTVPQKTDTARSRKKEEEISREAETSKPAKKSEASNQSKASGGTPIWLKLFFIIILAVIVYFFLQNWGSLSDSPIPKIGN